MPFHKLTPPNAVQIKKKTKDGVMFSICALAVNTDTIVISLIGFLGEHIIQPPLGRI